MKHQAETPRLYRNNGNGTFTNVTKKAGLDKPLFTMGCDFGDLDNDGDQDIYAVMGGSYEGDIFQNVLFENPGTSNHWITLFLEGVESNRYAIGTRIKVTVQTSKGKKDIYTTIFTGRQEIGLGNANAIEQIEITWPRTGKKQIFENVEIDQPVKIVEGRSEMIPHQLTALELAKENQSNHTQNDHH